MNEAYIRLRQSLAGLYGDGEAQAVALLVMEKVFGLTRTDIYCGKVRQISEDERTRFLNISQKLLHGVPVQYALGEADFLGRTFRVTPDVLVPRPETEELVQWAAAVAGGQANPHVLDAGTGSGCIAVSLKLECPQAEVEAWDLSQEALAVARGNAARLHADVRFARQDMLAPWPEDARYSIIVSNPPYIAEREKAEMEQHVLDHEPHMALFVPDADPLLFYRALGQASVRHLQPGGWLLVEINRAYAQETAALFRSAGLERVEIRRDAFGNERMVGGRRACSSENGR